MIFLNFLLSESFVPCPENKLMVHDLTTRDCENCWWFLLPAILLRPSCICIKVLCYCSLPIFSHFAQKPSCVKFWCQWSLCFWHCFSFFYNPQKEKKNMYTDIFIFIYWMQCRTLDTDTLNTWFPCILMNQNWGIFKDFSRTIFFFITRIFMANFTKHIYMLWLILSNFRSDLLLRVSKI